MSKVPTSGRITLPKLQIPLPTLNNNITTKNRLGQPQQQTKITPQHLTAIGSYPFFISIPIQLHLSHSNQSNQDTPLLIDTFWNNFKSLYSQQFLSLQSNPSQSSSDPPTTNINIPKSIEYLDLHHLHISLTKSQQHLPGADRGSFINILSLHLINRLRTLRKDTTLQWKIEKEIVNDKTNFMYKPQSTILQNDFFSHSNTTQHQFQISCHDIKLFLNDTNTTIFHSILLNNDKFTTIYNQLIQNINSFLLSIGKESYYQSPIPHFSFGYHHHQLTQQGQMVLNNQKKSLTNSIIINGDTIQQLKRLEEGLYNESPSISQILQESTIISETSQSDQSISDSTDLNNSDINLFASISTIHIKIGPETHIFPLF